MRHAHTNAAKRTPAGGGVAFESIVIGERFNECGTCVHAARVHRGQSRLVGSKITRVGNPDSNLNQLAAEQLALGPGLLQRVANPFFGTIPRSSSLEDPTDHGVTPTPFAAGPSAPLVGLDDPASQHSTVGFEGWPGDDKAELVEPQNVVRSGQAKVASGMSRSSRWAV